jgi:hypothetical protein
MTEATQATGVQNSPSFWEDVIEIFVHPADVFRRRANSSFWPPLLFVAITIGIITFATFNVLAPIFEAEFTRNMAKQVAENPQLAARMDGMRDTMLKVSKFTFPIILIISMMVLGLVTWLVAKMFDSKATAGQGLLIAAWAYMPRVLGSILGSAQALLMDPAKLNSQLAISLSPARFMDVETANPVVYQILGRLDLTVLWETALLAIGIYVVGKTTKNGAIIFGIVMWILGALPVIRNAIVPM